MFRSLSIPSHPSLSFKRDGESEYPSVRFQLTPVSALEWDTRPQKTSILPSPTHTYTLHQMKDTKQDLMHTCPPWLHLRGKRLKSQFRGTQTCVHIINGGVGSVWGSLAVCVRLISHHLGNMVPLRPSSFTYRNRDSCSVQQESKTYITHTHTRNCSSNNQPPKDSWSHCTQESRLFTLLLIF